MKIFQKTNEHKTSILSKSIKAITLAVLFLFSVVSMQAQGLELTPQVGYFWAGKLRTYNGELRLGDAMNYGLAVNYSTNPGTYFQIDWFISNTVADYYRYGYNDVQEEIKLTTNYIQVGVIQEMNYGSALRPFGLFTMGTTISSPENYYTNWLFSLGIGGGLKAYVSDRIGLRLQGRFLLPVYFNGGGVWCGTGGCGYGISTGTAIAQGDVSLGLIFVIQ